MSYTAVASALTKDAWFRLGETDKSSTVSSVVGSATGSVPGNVTLGVTGNVAGDSDTAASFSGAVGSFITFSNLPSSISAFSMWCMVKHDDVGSNDYIFSHAIDASNYIAIFWLSGGTLEARCEIGGVVRSCSATPSLSNGVWYRLAVVIDPADSDRRDIYVNESEIASDTTSTIGTTLAATLGARWDGGVRMAGDADELILNYGSTAWTDAQVTAIGNAAQGLGGASSHYYYASQGAAA